MKIAEFDMVIDRENVFHLIDCYPDSPVYEEVVEEFEELEEEAFRNIKPVALLEFGCISDYDLSEYGENITEALYNVNSVGGELSRLSTEAFEEGNYLRGMLLDAIADDYLFQIDKKIQKQIVALCKEHGYGIIRRLEAPQDIPMEAQRTAFDVTRAKEQIGLDIKESFMYDPVKSTCQIYLLDKGSTEYKIEHDCSKCPQIHCKMRNLQKFPVIVKKGNTEMELMGTERESLMEILQKNDIYLSAVCAGKGTCGKCKVQLLEGEIVPSTEDKKFFSEEELKKGYRLACKAYPNKRCVVSLDFNNEDGFVVVADHRESGAQIELSENGRYAIAVDIGTTTIAMQLVNIENKSVVDVFTTINRQRAYGADVISRIEASNSGKMQELQKSILEDLKAGIRELLKNREIEVEKMVIGANTTMVHLLMGYSCETLGVFPFTAVNLDTIHISYDALFKTEEYSFEIVILPGISTYVGGDITAGLYTCDFDKRDKVAVLIDLGTNGEMAAGCKDRILVTSTAAGPAFEGGNITHGTGSVQGAICNVTLKDGKAEVKTIGDAAPQGICGTGVIDIVYELMKEEVIDETGLLDEDYFDEGFPLAENIAFYQKDVREIQLAKSAVRAGLETLLLRYGAAYDEIDKIYIAGGFGYKMDVQKAIGIGLLPEECADKIEAVGNSSLRGAVGYLLDEDAADRIEKIISCSSEINLSNDKKFNEFYMDYMYFES